MALHSLNISMMPRRCLVVALVVLFAYVCCSMGASAFCLSSNGQRFSRQSNRFFLFIDGDTVQQDSVEKAVSLLKERGVLVQSRFFAYPEFINNQKWNQLLARNDVRFCGIPRSKSLRGDPTDEALEESVRRLLLQTKKDDLTVALLLKDRGYVPLVRDIVAKGWRCLVLIDRSASHILTTGFEDAGAEVIYVSVKPAPKFKAVLQGSGEGYVVPVAPSEAGYCQTIATPSFMARFLCHLRALEFIHKKDNPWIPAVAKAWFCHGLGDLTVFPAGLLIRNMELISLDQLNIRAERSLSFILPVKSGKPSKTALSKYGSKTSYMVARAGGPFIVEDGQHMRDDFATRLLSRLGFLDSDLNQNLNEALQTFWRVSIHKYHLLKVGALLPDELPRGQQGMELVRSIFTSPLFDGHLEYAPSDGQIREHFQRKGILTAQASQKDVFEAMRDFAKKHDIPMWQNYAGQVWQTNNFLHRNHPARRS